MRPQVGEHCVKDTKEEAYSFHHQLGFSRKYSSHAPITREDYSFTFPPLSIARYWFTQLSQLERQWRERKCPIFETVAKGDSNPSSLDCESGILPLSYRAPHLSQVTSTSSKSLNQVIKANIKANYSDTHQLQYIYIYVYQTAPF